MRQILLIFIKVCVVSFGFSQRIKSKVENSKDTIAEYFGLTKIKPNLYFWEKTFKNFNLYFEELDKDSLRSPTYGQRIVYFDFHQAIIRKEKYNDEYKSFFKSLQNDSYKLDTSSCRYEDMLIIIKNYQIIKNKNMHLVLGLPPKNERRKLVFDEVADYEWLEGGYVIDKNGKIFKPDDPNFKAGLRLCAKWVKIKE